MPRCSPARCAPQSAPTSSSPSSKRGATATSSGCPAACSTTRHEGESGRGAGNRSGSPQAHSVGLLYRAASGTEQEFRTCPPSGEHAIILAPEDSGDPRESDTRARAIEGAHRTLADGTTRPWLIGHGPCMSSGVSRILVSSTRGPPLTFCEGARLEPALGRAIAGIRLSKVFTLGERKARLQALCGYCLFRGSSEAKCELGADRARRIGAARSKRIRRTAMVDPDPRLDGDPRKRTGHHPGRRCDPLGPVGDCAPLAGST